jgi:tRNA(Ile)-lysidine synthase
MLNTSAAAAELFQLNDLFSGLAGSTRVAVAVSGGSDSMALLVLAHDWARTSGTQLVALTVDHGLRAASADEALQVAGWCAGLDVEHHVLQWLGTKPESGIQAAARVARYDVMSEWCKAHHCHVLLTAHTLDDQAETLVMRKVRTTTVKSLAGIWKATVWRDVRVLRPLLGLRREALRELLRQRGQKWLDDPSNEDERFERVRVRNALKGVDVVALGLEAHEAQAETARIAAFAAQFFKDAVYVDALGFVTFERKAFAAVPQDVGHEILARAMFVAGAGVRPLRESVSAVVQWIADGHSGRRTVAGSVISVRVRDILVGREAGRIARNWVPVDGTVLWDGRFEIAAPAGCLVGPALLVSDIRRPEGLARFVLDGLPVVKLPDGRAILSLDGEKFGISTMFRERIWF